MEVEKIKEITEEQFMELLSVVSDWYDKHNLVSALKVLYTDHVPNKFEVHKADKTRDLLELLISSGDIDSTDISLIYDTIIATNHFGLVKELKKRIPSFPNVKEMNISKLEIHRQRLINLAKTLCLEDTEKISGYYITPVKKYTDSWSLIMDLEKQRIICADKMESFIKKLRDLGLHSAVEALESEPKSGCTPPDCAAIDVTVKPKSETEPVEYIESPLFLLEKVLNNVGKLKFEEFKQFIKVHKEIAIYFQEIQASVCNISTGSLVFHLTVSDPAALQFLWKIHKSKDLIKHLAKLLVSKKFQQDFLDKWTTEIDRDQYEAGLRKLEWKEKLNIATPEETYHMTSTTSKRTAQMSTRDAEHKLHEPPNPKKIKLETPEVSRDETYTTQLAELSQKTNPFTAVNCQQDLPNNECEKQNLQTPSETEQVEKIKQVKQTNLIQLEKIMNLKVELEMLKKRKSIKEQKSLEKIKQEIMQRKKVLRLVFLFSLRLQSLKYNYGTKDQCLTDALADEIEQVHQKIEIQKNSVRELEDELYYIKMSKIEDSIEVQKNQARIEQEIEQRMKEDKSQRLVIQKLLSHKWDLETQHENLERSMADALMDKNMFKKEDSKGELKKYDKFEQELIMQRKEKIFVICFWLQLRSLQSNLETNSQHTFDALLMGKIEKERQKYQVQREKTQDLQAKLMSRKEIKQSNDAVKSQKLVIQQLEILQRNLKRCMADMLTSKMFEREDSDETKQLPRSMVCEDEGPPKKEMKMGPSEMYERSEDFTF
ncbi:myosin-9-like [Anneissia japonica]|uniref:myosin-9-like n=1 Tax=Anneissia japonica TaxID=1529436 RepID=UPI0014256BBA|nr:myosin-9-like [Anneissia japonica]XP_033107549.1 myosin-9-like [Anneissia japonica]XP_033107550.1 myosin-9-like [Anneissia japonica]